MNTLGKLYKRNFEDGEKWYAVPDLSWDFFISDTIPNDDYIKQNGLEVISDNIGFYENQNIMLERVPKNKCIIKII